MRAARRQNGGTPLLPFFPPIKEIDLQWVPVIKKTEILGEALVSYTENTYPIQLDMCDHRCT